MNKLRTKTFTSKLQKMKKYIVVTFILSGLSFIGYSQTQPYKIDLKQGCVIMKDFMNGGIMEVFGWQPQSGKLILSLSDNLIELNNGKSITKYYITKIITIVR